MKREHEAYPQIDTKDWTWEEKIKCYDRLQAAQTLIFQHKSLLSYCSLVGGFGEEATKEAFGGTRPMSGKGHDVVTRDGTKLEVKTIDLRHEPGAGVSWPKNDTFDFLVIVETIDLRVIDAWKIPASVLPQRASNSKDGRWWLSPEKWRSIPESENVTNRYKTLTPLGAEQEGVN